MLAVARKKTKPEISAEDILAQLREEIRELSRAVKPDRPAAPTFVEYAFSWCQEYATRGLSPGTARVRHVALTNWLFPVVGKLRLDEIGPAEVQAVKDHMQGLAANTKNSALSLLKTILRDAHLAGFVERPPVVRMIKVPRRTAKHHEAAVVARLVEAARIIGQREHAAILLCVDAGLRASEVAGLCWNSVRFDIGQLAVVEQDFHRRSIDPKGKRPRIVPMTPRLMDALRELRGVSGRVFRDRQGRSLTGSQIYYFWRKVAVAAGVDWRGGIHALRHSFVSRLQALGVDVTTVRDLAGHSSIAITDRYSHSAAGASEAAIKSLADSESWTSGTDKTRTESETDKKDATSQKDNQ